MLRTMNLEWLNPKLNMHQWAVQYVIVQLYMLDTAHIKSFFLRYKLNFLRNLSLKYLHQRIHFKKNCLGSPRLILYVTFCCRDLEWNEEMLQGFSAPNGLQQPYKIFMNITHLCTCTISDGRFSQHIPDSYSNYPTYKPSNGQHSPSVLRSIHISVKHLASTGNLCKKKAICSVQSTHNGNGVLQEAIFSHTRVVAECVIQEGCLEQKTCKQCCHRS